MFEYTRTSSYHETSFCQYGNGRATRSLINNIHGMLNGSQCKVVRMMWYTNVKWR